MAGNWSPFGHRRQDKASEDKAEVGRGSEGGHIVRDEEHLLGARITLEKDCEVAPYAITCGIYGWMMHTCFVSDEGVVVQQYEEMKAELGDLLERSEELANDEEGQRAFLTEGCGGFVERFP
jgi:hypothetical protein